MVHETHTHLLHSNVTYPATGCGGTSVSFSLLRRWPSWLLKAVNNRRRKMRAAYLRGPPTVLRITQSLVSSFPIPVLLPSSSLITSTTSSCGGGHTAVVPTSDNNVVRDRSTCSGGGLVDISDFCSDCRQQFSGQLSLRTSKPDAARSALSGRPNSVDLASNVRSLFTHIIHINYVSYVCFRKYKHVFAG